MLYMCSLLIAFQHPCELWVGFMSIHRRGHWSPEKFSNWPKVPRPSSSSSRMQTQDQSCPYNLSTVGESARKSSGLGVQGKAAIRIWFLLAKQISMSALGHSLCTDPWICPLRHPLSSCWLQGNSSGTGRWGDMGQVYSRYSELCVLCFLASRTHDSFHRMTALHSW